MESKFSNNEKINPNIEFRKIHNQNTDTPHIDSNNNQMLTSSYLNAQKNEFTSQSSRFWPDSPMKTPNLASSAARASQFWFGNEFVIQKKVESQQILIKFSFPVVDPYGNFTKFWNGLIFVVMIYVATLYPLRLSLIEDDNNWITMDMVIDTIFLLDVIVNAITAFEDIKGGLVYHLHKIIFNYLRGWFVVDFISAFPFYLVIEGPSSLDKGNMPPLYKLTKIPRLFRLAKISSFLTKIFLNFKISRLVLDTIKLSIFILFLIHLSGCFWIMIAFIEDNTENNWLFTYNLQDEDHATIYLSSIYFSLTVFLTIGYGNITAISPTEKLFVIGLMMVGIACFGFIMASLINVFSGKMVNNNSQIEQKEMFFLEISKDFSIPNGKLEKILIRNENLGVSHCVGKINSFHLHKSLFNSLPFSLQKELFSFVYNELLEKIEFFQDKPYRFLMKMCSKMQPFFLKKGDEIYRDGDLATEVYFIMKGRIVSKCIDEFGLIRTLIFMEGGYFGETDVILRRGRNESAYAETDVEIWKIFKNDFLEILNEWKDIESEIEKRAYQKIQVRRTGMTSRISIKNHLPATYFLSKLRKSNKKFKTMINNIIMKSGKVIEEMKFVEEKKFNNCIKNMGIEDFSVEPTIETSEKEIKRDSIEKLVFFLKQNFVHLEKDDLNKLFKLKNENNSAKLQKIKEDKKKVDDLLGFLKNLKGILSSQEQELLILFKLNPLQK